MAERTGLILAAGYGSRLKGTASQTDFKPLTPVNGIPIIFRTINSLKLAGCSKVSIVLGYGHEEIKETIRTGYDGGIPLEFVFNKDYHLKNGVSVLAAKEMLGDSFLLTMADHIIGDSVMELAANHTPPENGATLLVDYKLDSIFDFNDATKVLTDQQGYISRIGKKIPSYNCVDTGVFVCTHGLIEALDSCYKKYGDTSLSDGIQQLAYSGQAMTLDIQDGYWQDVDTPEMLEHAENRLSILESV